MVRAVNVVDEPWGDPLEDAGRTLPPPSRLPRGKRVIAVGGGRGGVGKSTLAVNLAVYFAQLGRSVVLCDADPNGSNLHAMLGLREAPLVPLNLDEPQLAPIPTPVPGLALLPTTYDVLAMGPIKPTRRSQWQQQFHHVEADYVLLHLGASLGAPSLDLFSSADIGVCVAAPEPVAIESTYGFLRALFSRALRRRLMREKLKRKLADRALGHLRPLATPLDDPEPIAVSLVVTVPPRMSSAPVAADPPPTRSVPLDVNEPLLMVSVPALEASRPSVASPTETLPPLTMTAPVPVVVPTARAALE
jgi:MinD-like ATPase involved in chromosome partitioning or flagellar assembly